MLIGTLPAVALPASAAEDTTSGACGDNLTWTRSSNGNITISGTGPMYDYSPEEPAPWHQFSQLFKFYIEEGVTRIGAYAFYGLSQRSTSIRIPRSVVDIGEKAFANLGNLTLYFYCKAPAVSPDILENSTAVCYRIYGWEDAALQTYGGTKVTWKKGSVQRTSDVKFIYTLNEPIVSEDFVLKYYHTSSETRLYSPADLQVGQYDNSVPGSKTVEITADGITFTHKYFVYEGNLCDAITVDMDPIQYYENDYRRPGVRPEPVVKLGEIILTQNTHYSVAYENNTSVNNDAQLIVTGLGPFEGFKKTVNFAILKRNVSGATIYVNSLFTGKPVTTRYGLKLVDGDVESSLYAGRDHVSYYSQNINIGTATYYGVGIGNYCGIHIEDFRVVARNNNAQLSLKGAYNGQADGRLDYEQYIYQEEVIAPAVVDFRIDSAIDHIAYNHVGYYQLYRIENGESILIDTYESVFASPSETMYTYDFTHVYEADAATGGATYMLTCTWVNQFNMVFSNVTMIYVLSKVPNATAMAIGTVEDTGTYRNGYFTAYGLDGHLDKATWSSSDPTIASIEDGVLTMYKPGTVTITAKSGGLSATADIQVVAEDISSACIFSYNGQTGKPIVLYDGFLLEEGVDYATSVSTQGNETLVVITGCGVFEGQVSRTFDANFIPLEPAPQPETPAPAPTLTATTPLETGDQIILYSPSYNLALSPQHAPFTECHKLGIPVAIYGNNLVGCTDSDIWKVSKTSGNNYTLAGSTGMLSMAETFNGLLSSSSYTNWQLCPLDNGTYALRNVSRNAYVRWSEEYGVFTTGTGDPREDASYQLQLWVLPKASDLVQPLTAPVVRKDGLTLRWDPIQDAEYYEVYRATSKNGEYTLANVMVNPSYVDSTAPIGKTYYYKVIAIYAEDISKNSGYSNVVSVTFTCEAPYVYAENGSNGKPVISWSAVNGAKKYTVYRATSKNGKYTKLGTTTKLSYTDSKAKAGYTYFYKVIANGSKSSYNSGYSNIVSCGVICGTPSVTVKIDANTGKPSLSWKKVDAATGYVIYRDGELLTTVTAVTYADTTAAIDTQYSYQVQALGKTEDLNGSLSKAVSATSGIAKPAAKGSVDTVSGKPVITWQAVEGAVKYEIYRSTKSSKSYKLVATVEELTYTDETVSAGKTYYYKVKAIGAVSKSADSSYVKLTGKCATPVISVSNDAKGKPYITWEKVSGAKKYTVYRATSETGKYTKLGTTTKAYYTDSKASAGKTYFYKIVSNASSSKNNSPYSNIVSCGVNCAAPVAKVSNNAAGQVVISWAKISGAKQYKVLYMDVTDYTDDVDPHEDFKKYHETAITTQTSFTLPDMDVGRFYMVSVVAIADNEELSSQPGKEIFAVIVPATPKITGKVGENKKPVISWGEVEGATKYVIYRSTSKSKGYKVIGESETLTYEDLTAKKGKTYYYKVVAIGNGFKSAQSAYVKIKSK